MIFLVKLLYLVNLWLQWQMSYWFSFLSLTHKRPSLYSDYHLRHTSWITFLLYIFLPFYVLQNKSHYSWFYSSVFHASFCHKMTNSLRRRSLHLSPLYGRWFECPWHLVFSELKAMFLPDHADNCERILCAFKLVKFFFSCNRTFVGYKTLFKLFL